MFINKASAENSIFQEKTKPCFELMIDFMPYVRLHAGGRLVDIAQGNCEFLVSVNAIFTNYKALRFSLPIAAMAKKLVGRMVEKSSLFGGKYVSVHLRFEEVSNSEPVRSLYALS
ncbi:hypothetical protein BHE74_00018684 [Ensete ventricosum]|nr:hypothetical protein BHE74_00018684 [Ensete ventricosum]RZR92392.1 hypothetical protein BHM03_00020698 [Ensete ventricosum]